MQKENEQTQNAISQPAAAEEIQGEKGGTVSLGKFKDANALLDAYNSLQAEFTKRCQRLKELERAEKPAEQPEQIPAVAPEKSITPSEKEEILRDYLKELLTAKTSAIVLDGVGAELSSPVTRPKNIAEAGILAKELINKNK